METLSISKSNLSSILASLSLEEKMWAIKFIADSLTNAFPKAEAKPQTASSTWKDYVISDEVMSMTIKNRKNVSSDNG